LATWRGRISVRPWEQEGLINPATFEAVQGKHAGNRRRTSPSGVNGSGRRPG